MTIHYSNDEEIERLGIGFLSRTWPKAQWTHAAHFAAVFWMLRHRADISPERDMPGFIRRYNEACDCVNSDTSGYHETITRASLRAARAFLAAHAPSQPLHELVDALMASPLGDSQWLLEFWSKPRLFSVEARRGWVEPDLKPFAY